MEYISVKISREVYNVLLRIQGLLQYRDQEKYTLSRIIKFLIENMPEIDIPLDEDVKVVTSNGRESSTSKA